MSTYKPKLLVNQLFMLLKTAQIHDPSNRAFQHPLSQFRTLLDEMITAEGPVTLESVELSLYLNEEKIRSDISTFATFRFLQDEFENKNVAGIRFLSVPTIEEITEFVRTFGRHQDPSKLGAQAINDLLSEKNVSSLELVEQTDRRTATEKGGSREVALKRQALKNYVKAIDVVRESSIRMNSSQPLDARKAKRVVYNLVDICLEEGFSFMGLSSIKNYDEYTFNHSVNVCIISIGFGKNIGLSKKQIGEVGIAGLYHDYGKLKIPLQILNKPGKFDPEEWEVMKSHPLESVKTLLDMKSFSELDIKKMIAAFEHHRNYDSTGYPQTGVKKEMNFYSKVVAIADAYDAMTTNRVYQRAMLPTVALKILTDHAGTKFDPILVKAFVNTIGVYPVGSVVRLNDGVMAIVTSVSKDPAKLQAPIIKIIADAGGRRLQNGPTVDLSTQPENKPQWVITDAIRPEEENINVAQYLFGDAAPQNPTS